MNPTSPRGRKWTSEYRWTRWYVANAARRAWRRQLKRGAHKADRQHARQECRP